MLILSETPAGFALFSVLDDKICQSNAEDLYKHFETPEAAHKVVKLKAFHKFESTTDALEAATAIVEGSLSKSLKKFLKRSAKDNTLAIADPKLANAIHKKLGLEVVSDSTVMELFRGIRYQLSNLISGLGQTEMSAMILGLSHSLSRYKLKFSPDKVDTMIIQAVALLDDLDKELNTYSMRVKEWYGWHFPEMGKVIVDNLAYAKVVKVMGMRTNAENTDLSSILPEELESEVKQVAEISMGTEISTEDIENITYLADQIISISEYRIQLHDYLKNRMMAIAPNLTCLVGELVGARLIAHAGSLMNLAKHPASTVQILGAEKALFRALKTKHDTPKYGLIYHASLIGQANPKNKGKVARLLAAKTALSCRVDALGEKDTPDVGIANRQKVEDQLRRLGKQGEITRISGTGKKQKRFEPGTPKSYNTDVDHVRKKARVNE